MLNKLTEVFQRTYLPNKPQHYTKSQGLLIELRNRIKELAPELRTIAKLANEMEEYRPFSGIVKEAKQMVGRSRGTFNKIQEVRAYHSHLLFISTG